MPYSSFRKIQEVTKKFDLSLKSSFLFEGIQAIIPSDFLLLSLKRGEQLGYSSEKERSERLAAPILSEMCLLNNITLYSGRELDADSKNDLNGECDYLLAMEEAVNEVVSSPIFSVAEAKKQDMDYGIAQCAAQLYGAKLFNEQDKNPLNRQYGCATTGVEWRFLRLENQILTLDKKRYTIGDLGQLLGAIQYIINDCKKVN